MAKSTSRITVGHLFVKSPKICGKQVAALAHCFGLPLEGWYPPEAAPSVPRPIAWQELCDTIGGVYDIGAESRRLKEHPGDFESLRDRYAYRREYF